jgi:hypothetical protein
MKDKEPKLEETEAFHTRWSFKNINLTGVTIGLVALRGPMHFDNNCELLFIIRVKRELKRVYRNGCRYNERLNAETGGSKTPHIHWVVRVNIQ